MIRIETSTGEILSRILKEVSPITYTSNKQVNKLFDGSYHVQIIGSPIKEMEAVIIASHTQADMLNYLIDQGTQIVFIFMEKKFLIYIDEKIQWKRINFGNGNKEKSFFEGNIKMVIKEEVLT